MLSKLLSRFLAWLLGGTIAFAETIIPGGNVSGTWEASGSPYLIEGEITILSGDTLNIEPGVDVIFQGYYKLVVNGCLEAIGTESDSILFTPADTAIAWHGIRFINAMDSSHLSYCIVQYGKARGINPHDYCGGGIYSDNSNLQIDHCTIIDNKADYSWEGMGGGIYCSESNIAVGSSVVSRNAAAYFGGGIFSFLSTITITNSFIEDNYGVGLHHQGGFLEFSNSIVKENNMGGIFIDSNGSTLIDSSEIRNNGSMGIALMGVGNTVVRYCTISDNDWTGVGCGDSDTLMFCLISHNTGNSGGGITCQGNTVIMNCEIRENHANYAGGGIYCTTQADPVVSYCVIADNSSHGTGYDGGGIHCNMGEISIDHCTITGNHAILGGGGIDLNNSDLSMIHTIVEGNSGNGGINFSILSEADITFSDFFANQNGNFSGNNIPANLGELVSVNANGDSCDIFFNILEDPAFVDTTWNDYRLQWGSPCIDAGNPDSLYNDPDGSKADIGAFYCDQSSPISILLTPHGVPIEIPPEGGSFGYTIRATNIISVPQLVNIWCDATLPNGTIYGPVLGPVAVTLDSGVTIYRERTQAVPPEAPGGSYSYSAYAVADSDTSADDFGFMKLGSDGLDGMSGWINSGESFDNLLTLNKKPFIPETHSLDQNHPNPFNPMTTISFTLPNKSMVSLSVYDVSGRRVVQLIDGWREAGYHRVIFDATNLASGIYIYKIRAGSYLASRKMVLVK